MYDDLSETTIAIKVVSWLEGNGWDVYQEVTTHDSKRRADIVGVLGKRVWVIETKCQLGLPAIEQAYHWQTYAHWVSIAAPFNRDTFAGKVIADYGIGLIKVPRRSGLYPIESIRAKLNRRALADRILSVVCAKHKTEAAAGSKNGGYWTPFKQTCANIARYVEQHPGVLLTELINKTQHHYNCKASARSAIALWAEQGKIDGVFSCKFGGRIRFFPNRSQP